MIITISVSIRKAVRGFGRSSIHPMARLVALPHKDAIGHYPVTFTQGDPVIQHG